MNTAMNNPRLLSVQDAELFGIYVELKHTTSWAFTSVYCIDDPKKLIFITPFRIYSQEEQAVYLPCNFRGVRIEIADDNYER